MSEKGTEQASPQKKLKARQQGDVIRSRELLSALAMLAGVVVLGGMAHAFVHDWRAVFEQSLTAAAVNDLDGDQRWAAATRRMLAPALVPMATVMGASFLAALSAGIAQGGGLSLHPNALSLKFNRLSPVTNLGNLFSLRGVTRLVKSLVPAAAMVIFGWLGVKALVLPMPVMSTERLPMAFHTAYSLTIDAAWVTLAWSGLDYAVEWVSWNKRQRMTKQEVKDEIKQMMGNPQVKGRIRQVQNAMRRRRVKADLSRASVVITNPTHYAVALEFSFETMSAPTVLAKGRDLHAAEIREEARWAGVPLIENPPLARSLYKAVEPGQSIPFELYAAVAGILAFLYRQQVEEKVREQKRQAAQQDGARQAAQQAAQRSQPGAGLERRRQGSEADGERVGHEEAPGDEPSGGGDQHGLRDADPDPRVCAGCAAGDVHRGVRGGLSHGDPGEKGGRFFRLSHAAFVTHTVSFEPEHRVQPQDPAARARGNARRGRGDRGLWAVCRWRQLCGRVCALPGAGRDPVSGGGAWRGQDG